jgi:hypothetical protein
MITAALVDLKLFENKRKFQYDGRSAVMLEERVLEHRRSLLIEAQRHRPSMPMRPTLRGYVWSRIFRLVGWT